MGEITSDCTFRRGASGDLIILNIVTPATAATGDTIDLDSDISGGKGAILTKILNTLVQDDAGADKTATWDPDTGILTLGSITTGIHNITVIGY